MSAHLRAGPFRALKMRQEAVHSLWSRLFCGPLKMRRVPEKAVFGTEYLFRTVEACFLHRTLLKMRRVPQEAFLSTARIFRTIGGPLRYRMPTTQPPNHSTPSTPVPNARHRGRLPPQWSLAYILVDLFVMWGIFNKFAQINRGLAMQDSTRREFHLYETLFDN